MVGIWWFTVSTMLSIFEVTDRAEPGDNFLNSSFLDFALQYNLSNDNPQFLLNKEGQIRRSRDVI